MDRSVGVTTSPPPTNQHDNDPKNVKLPSFSSLFASIQPQPPTKTSPTPLGHRSDWNALTEVASAEYSQSAPSGSPWLANNRPTTQTNHDTNSTPSSKPQHQPQPQNIRLPPIHLVSPSGGYLHPLPSGLVGGPNGLPISRESRGPRSPPSSHRKRSNSLTGHPYAYAPSSRSTYEPPPVVTDLGRRPSLGNFGGAGPPQPSQVGPSGLSRRARMQSRSPPRGYEGGSTRGRAGSPTQPRVVDYAGGQRGRTADQADEHRSVAGWEREGQSQRQSGSSYSSSVSPAPGSYAEHYNRPDPYYSNRTTVASDLSALHISQGDSYRPLSSHGPLPPMNTAPPYAHPPRSQPLHMPPPPSRAPPQPAGSSDSNGQRNGSSQSKAQGQSWSAQPPPPARAYQATEANPHAVPVGASAPPEVGRYACPHCPKRFARPSSLRIHIHSHTGEKPFACPHCHRGFSVQSNLRRHLKIHRSNGTVIGEESEGGGSMSDEEGSEEAMEVTG